MAIVAMVLTTDVVGELECDKVAPLLRLVPLDPLPGLVFLEGLGFEVDVALGLSGLSAGG
jgi:hypothetical protein